MYLFVVKGKGTTFYNIGVSGDLDEIDCVSSESPFKPRLFAALETERPYPVLSYLRHYFADQKTNADWFDLSPKQAAKLKSMLDDPDNLLSDVSEDGYRRVAALPPRLWKRLDKFAEQTGSIGQKGAELGQPSWRGFLKRIAESPKLLRLIEQELNGHPGVSIPKQYQEAVIVRPEDTKTESLVWLNVDGDKISVDFPEKRKDNTNFEWIAETFGLKWDGKVLSRFIDQWAGDPTDRAAELGHKLLANGFSVVFPGERIQEMAIAGEYEPECRRWVLASREGKYEGWFVLRWAYAEDCYEAAKGISGSWYDKPDVVAPPEQFAEVIDFAQMYRFRFSQGALALVVQAKAMLDSALLVSVEQREDEDYPLDLPTLAWEDDDLADDIKYETDDEIFG